MIKKVIFIVTIIANIFLAVGFVIALSNAAEELKFEYVEEDTLLPDTLRLYLDKENYGTVAARSRQIRAGAAVSEADIDNFRLGEYAELSFLKEVFEKGGSPDSAKKCEERITSIREEMPGYGDVLDKIDLSVENAVRK